ncbi:MAG: hypothetical protein KAR54_00890 [Candidatus Pacebacteria bacterium]|nr:hypothetical protein [Candidatus Paceibacterota bacterium]
MKTKQILKWPLIVGIVIVLNLFFLYAIKVAYPKPVYEDFCQKEQVIERIDNQEQCLEKGGQWDENIGVIYDRGIEIPIGIEGRTKGYCNLNFVCNNEYDEARENYEKNVFIMLIILGVVSVVAGFLTIGKEVVSIALSLGGVLSFVIASIRYWQYASDWLHLIILGIALAVLMYLAIKKFTE